MCPKHSGLHHKHGLTEPEILDVLALDTDVALDTEVGMHENVTCLSSYIQLNGNHSEIKPRVVVEKLASSHQCCGPNSATVSSHCWSIELGWTTLLCCAGLNAGFREIAEAQYLSQTSSQVWINLQLHATSTVSSVARKGGGARGQLLFVYYTYMYTYPPSVS